MPRPECPCEDKVILLYEFCSQAPHRRQRILSPCAPPVVCSAHSAWIASGRRGTWNAGGAKAQGTHVSVAVKRQEQGGHHAERIPSGSSFSAETPSSSSWPPSIAVDRPGDLTTFLSRRSLWTKKKQKFLFHKYMAAHCRVDSVCRAGEAAVEEGGYGAVAAARRPAGSAIGRFARCCAVLAVAALAVAALAGASGDTKPAGLAATWGYAGTGAHTLVMLRQRDIGSLLDHAHQLELEATEATVATTKGSEADAAAGEEAASSPASVAESAEPTEADEDPSLVAMGVKDVPVPTLEPRALVNGVEPGAIALYPGEPDPDANGSQADLDIMHDIEQDEMERPPPGYQGMISMNVCATHSPQQPCAHWCSPFGTHAVVRAYRPGMPCPLTCHPLPVSLAHVLTLVHLRGSLTVKRSRFCTARVGSLGCQ